MTVGNILSLIGLGITAISTIIGFVFTFGRLSERLRVLEDRMKEDREKNEKQHEEFYTVKSDTIAMATKLDAVVERLGGVETGIREILDRLPRSRRLDD